MWVSHRDSPDQGDKIGRCRLFHQSRKRPRACRQEVRRWRRPQYRRRLRRQSDVRGLLRGARVVSRLRRYANRCGILHTPAPAPGLDLVSVPAWQLRQPAEAASKLVGARLEWRLSSARREKFSRPSRNQYTLSAERFFLSTPMRRSVGHARTADSFCVTLPLYRNLVDKT